MTELVAVGNYSSLTFKFKLRREIGYYIMDYFLPSMFLVATSWVTFWLQADASAPRAVLGECHFLIARQSDYEYFSFYFCRNIDNVVFYYSERRAHQKSSKSELH